mgnify:CR=1 FL=1
MILTFTLDDDSINDIVLTKVNSISFVDGNIVIECLLTGKNLTAIEHWMNSSVDYVSVYKKYKRDLIINRNVFKGTFPKLIEKHGDKMQVTLHADVDIDTKYQ